ncbi:MAG: hypothetical protein M3167_11830 [Acidobacteriota bacterium]|nr:hypothetical protein [Acidobacteriota bacterium]
MDSSRVAAVVPSLLLPVALSRTFAIRAAEPKLHPSPRGPSLLLILRV